MSASRREISEPGVYLDMPAADYHADPCPFPSLSASLAKTLLNFSPWHAWKEHPRLNPAFEREDPTKFDVGKTAHTLMLGRGAGIVVVEADDWRTKDAKEARAQALEVGLSPVLREQYERAKEMVASAVEQLKHRGLVDDWVAADGASEVVLAVDDGDTWLRTMIDLLPVHRSRVWDYKTTGMSAAPGDGIDRMMVDMGWDVQAAMHELCLDALDPDGAGRRKHFFLVQENFEPFAINPVLLSEAAMTMGRKKLGAARDLWVSCLKARRWPGYQPAVYVARYPEWAERRWLEREENGSLIAARPKPTEQLTNMAGG